MVAVLNAAQGLEIKGLSENNCITEGEQLKAPPANNLNILKSSGKRTNPNTDNLDQVLKKKIRIENTEIPAAFTPTNIPRAESQPSIPKQREVLKVKEEINPVTIDMDVHDQGSGDVVDCDALGRELSDCQDLSTGTCFDVGEADGVYQGEFYQEGIDHMGQFDNVS